MDHYLESLVLKPFEYMLCEVIQRNQGLKFTWYSIWADFFSVRVDGVLRWFYFDFELGKWGIQMKAMDISVVLFITLSEVAVPLASMDES